MVKFTNYTFSLFKYFILYINKYQKPNHNQLLRSSYEFLPTATAFIPSFISVSPAYLSRGSTRRMREGVKVLT